MPFPLRDAARISVEKRQVLRCLNKNVTAETSCSKGAFFLLAALHEMYRKPMILKSLGHLLVST